MFLIIVLIITLVIWALRLSLIGTNKIQGTLRGRKLAINDARGVSESRIGKFTSSAVDTAMLVGKSGIKLVILSLRWVRGIMLSIGMVLLIYEVIFLMLLYLGAAGAFVLFFADKTNSNSNYTTDQQQEGMNSGTQSVSFDSIDDKSVKEFLEKLKESWGSDVTPERVKIITLGATRIGHSTYSQGGARGGDSDDQTVFDCSSFTGWCYNKAGFKDVSCGSTTATFVLETDKWKKISIDELIPGDVVLNRHTTDLGNANHAGIYVGKYNGKMMFMHCTTPPQETPMKVSTGVRIGEHPSFQNFYRYKGFK